MILTSGFRLLSFLPKSSFGEHKVAQARGTSRVEMASVVCRKSSLLFSQDDDIMKMCLSVSVSVELNTLVQPSETHP